jgi:predicted DNA-binding transcriptional regulator AlpA
MEALLTPPQLAEHLNVPVQSLAQMRYEGKGPKYIKIGGRVRYRSSEVAAWLDECTRSGTATMESTSYVGRSGW